jgi:hypothetical protein
MGYKLTNSQRTVVSATQRVSLRRVAAGSAICALIAAGFFLYQNANTEKAMAKKSAPLSGNATLTVCPGENVQLEAAAGDYVQWTPSEGLNNANIPNPVAAPLKTTVYTATIYTALDNVLHDTGMYAPQNGSLFTRSFKTTMHDSYRIALAAHSSDPMDIVQLQVRINNVPVLRTAVNADVNKAASVIWQNGLENSGQLSVHVLNADGFHGDVYIDALDVVLLERDQSVTQVFVDKNCQVSASQ